MFIDTTLEAVGSCSLLCGHQTPISVSRYDVADTKAFSERRIRVTGWIEVFPERCPEHDRPITITTKAGRPPEQPPKR